MQDPETGKLVLDKQALLKEYQFFARARELGVLKPSLLGTDWSIWHRTVTSKQVGLWVGGSWQVAEWQDQYGLSDADVQDLATRCCRRARRASRGSPSRTRWCTW